jgi:hypothetical protein
VREDHGVALGLQPLDLFDEGFLVCHVYTPSLCASRGGEKEEG